MDRVEVTDTLPLGSRGRTALWGFFSRYLEIEDSSPMLEVRVTVNRYEQDEDGNTGWTPRANR